MHTAVVVEAFDVLFQQASRVKNEQIRKIPYCCFTACANLRFAAVKNFDSTILHWPLGRTTAFRPRHPYTQGTFPLCAMCPLRKYMSLEDYPCEKNNPVFYLYKRERLLFSPFVECDAWCLVITTRLLVLSLHARRTKRNQRNEGSFPWWCSCSKHVNTLVCMMNCSRAWCLK